MRKAIPFLAGVALSTSVVACDRGYQGSQQEPRPGSPATQATVSPGAPVMQGTPGNPTGAQQGAPNGERTTQPEERAIGHLEPVATFNGAMPTGVAVSHEGRIFVNFPRWSDPIDMSVAEIKNGEPTPYPDPQWNPAQPGDPPTTFVGVQSVFIDAKNRLWVLDTGTVKMGHVIAGGAKLVGFDLATNKPFVTISFDPTVALPTSYLNDVRFDLNRGKAGFAYISDSSFGGSNAIITVDLDSKKAMRRLVDHPSVKPAPGFLAIVEGAPLYKQQPGQARAPFMAGVDGIEVSPDGKTVYYSPLASRHLYSVRADTLADPNARDNQIAATVKDLGDKGASDGFLMADDGRLYVTEYESNAILRRNLDGTFEPVVADPRLLWPDSMALGTDGYLYVTSNQLDRQPMLQAGNDLRQKPYMLWRVKTGAPALRPPTH
jgi:sugar lactone lactonase YvrE